MQTSHKRKKAFTLTELLVVVIVIGVLSAVVLPKFSKVVETRKTTEAEELMSAVRTEQEKRCALDKNYLTDFKAIEDIAASKSSKNYAYSLTSTGMEAQSKGKYGYTLKMPSYADGRICCENEAECAKLNKDYPLCSALMARADYRSGAECAGEPEEKQCTGSSTQSCGCNNGGTQTRTCDTSTGTWSGWSACSISDACSCEGESTRACGCQGKGTQTRTCNTSNGTWGEWGACSVADECECTGTKPEESRTCNNCGTQTRSVTCNASTGEWSAGAWSACSKTQEECDEEKDCCSDSVSDFSGCILKKYGADSTEYVCANGSNIGWHPDIGSISGAAACVSKLVGFGCMLRAANNKCAASDTYCQKLRTLNSSWISGGFKKYACTGATPDVPKPETPTTPTDPNPGTFSCCRVELAPIKNFNYSDLFGQVNCLNAAGMPNAKCPDNIQPGVKMNGSHGGLNCTYRYDCPFSGYGQGLGPYKGFVQKLKCVNYGDTCTSDEVEWL